MRARPDTETSSAVAPEKGRKVVESLRRLIGLVNVHRRWKKADASDTRRQSRFDAPVLRRPRIEHRNLHRSGIAAFGLDHRAEAIDPTSDIEPAIGPLQARVDRNPMISTPSCDPHTLWAGHADGDRHGLHGL